MKALIPTALRAWTRVATSSRWASQQHALFAAQDNVGEPACYSTYRVHSDVIHALSLPQVRAKNAHPTAGPYAWSDIILLGLPTAPSFSGAAVTVGVGSATVTWTAPVTNSHIGTTYTAQLFRPSDLATPGLNVALTATGTTDGATITFIETLLLPAGPFRLKITTKNAKGAGDEALYEHQFTVGASGV